MQRSNSWPTLLILVAEDDGIRESTPDIHQALDSLHNKETECEELRNELAECETQYHGLGRRAEQLEIENQFLAKENENLKEENKEVSERLKIVEREQSQHKLRIRELECFMSNLQKNCEELQIDKRTLSEELSRQRSGYAELQCSKKDLEGQVKQMQESTEWRRKEDDQIRELVEESNFQRVQLEDMEQLLLAKETEARDVQLLRTENHEMEIQISQMVQQNIQLRRQLNDVTQSKDYLEQHSLALLEEMENLKMESSYSRESSPAPVIHCIAQEEEGDLAEEDHGDDDHSDDDSYESDSNSDRNSNEKIIQPIATEGNHPARTPPATISLAEECELMYNGHSTFDDKEDQIMPTNDALDEYLHLTAAAVKISFNMVPISSDELIQRAKKLPFYRAHDELTKYMKEKLKDQESSPPKDEKRLGWYWSPQEGSSVKAQRKVETRSGESQLKQKSKDRNQQQEPASKRKAPPLKPAPKRWQKNALWLHAIKHKPHTKAWRERYIAAVRIHKMGLRKSRAMIKSQRTESNTDDDPQVFGTDQKTHPSVLNKVRRLFRSRSGAELSK